MTQGRQYRKGSGTSRVVKITESFVQHARIGERRWIAMDRDLRGFGVAINAGSKSYFVMRHVLGRQVRHKFANVGEKTVAEARREAARLLGQMSAGVNPTAARRAERVAAQGAITLRQATDLAIEAMRAKGRAERTAVDYKGALETYLAGWMDRPLREITRAEVRERHHAIPGEIARGRYLPKKGEGRRKIIGDGRASANGVFRVLRAVYNRALREHPELPANPVRNVDFFVKAPHKAALTPEGLAAWFKAVQKVSNALRRDYLMFVLFSGMRRQSVSEMRWEDVDLKRRLLRVVRPKGGESRAFDLPLSDQLMEILERRKTEHEKIVADDERMKPWVWASVSATGHISEPREEGLPGTIHDLRRVFASVAGRLKINWADLKLLLNHALPGHDVTARYVTIDVDALRLPMQTITDELKRLCEPKRSSEKVVPMRRRARA